MKKPSAPSGPVEDGAWAQELSAHAVTLQASPRLWGYDVQEDLAKNYSFVETAWLAITGELPPSQASTQAFELVMAYLAPVTVAEAPAHAAGLTRVCGSNPASVVSVASVTLSQQAQYVLQKHETLWPFLSREGPWPQELSVGGGLAEPVRRLRDALQAIGHESPVFEHSPSLATACLAVLFELGMRATEQLLSVGVWCKLPYVIAEAFAVRPGRLLEYPMDLPKYEYGGQDD
ncbi:unnamed protein product [Laminaria digitata]